MQRLPTIANIYNSYGPTEATICATAWLVPLGDLSDLQCVPIGPPDPNMRAYVVDPSTLALLPPGAVGELLLAGPRTAVGYVGRPDLTAKVFIQNPCLALNALAGGKRASREEATWEEMYRRVYRTGDLASWRGDDLLFLGRVDAQVKVNGVRVEIGDVTAAVKTAPGEAPARFCVLDGLFLLQLFPAALLSLAA